MEEAQPTATHLPDGNLFTFDGESIHEVILFRCKTQSTTERLDFFLFFFYPYEFPCFRYEGVTFSSLLYMYPRPAPDHYLPLFTPHHE
jgi:hypothetical protein